MSLFIVAMFSILLVLELVSLVIHVFGWRAVGGTGMREPAAVRWRRILLHLGVWVMIIGGFWAIVHFGPLRPVHEWIR